MEIVGKSYSIPMTEKHDLNAEIFSVLFWMALLPQKLSRLVFLYLEAQVSPMREEAMPVLFISVRPAANEVPGSCA